jgi:hypothetical protein
MMTISENSLIGNFNDTQHIDCGNTPPSNSPELAGAIGKSIGIFTLVIWDFVSQQLPHTPFLRRATGTGKKRCHKAVHYLFLDT